MSATPSPLRLAIASLAIAFAGCASLPDNVPRTASHALPGSTASLLGRVARASLAAEPGHRSGFALLAGGDAAMLARLGLVERAQSSLDVQYYLIADDGTGREFLAALRRAAARGVRVRILVDDLYATGEDALFSGLAGLPNIEVRLFNPLPVRGRSFAGRIAMSLPQLGRINHRMHNKLFIADGAFAVLGGRNMADAYFGRGTTAHFIDMDVLAAGPVVAELAGVFDRFWNAERAYPVSSLIADAASAAGEAGDDDPPLVDVAVAGSLAAQLQSGVVALVSGDADVVADLPEKNSAADGGRVSAAHLAMVASARSEVLLASPYFVPGQPVLDALSRLASTDEVRVSVLTNSLAATDEPLAHAGYMQHRLELLRAGVSLHELVPTTDDDRAADGARAPAAFRSIGRLHGKLTVVDLATTFIGSMNVDHRSENCNTEAGVIVHSAALAGQVADFIRYQQVSASYELRLVDGRARPFRPTAKPGERAPDVVDAVWEGRPGMGMRLVARLARGILWSPDLEMPDRGPIMCC